MRQFEWCCMIAALINLGLTIVMLLRIFNHEFAKNAASASPTSLPTADMIFIGIGVGTLLVTSPFMSMPYWLGLLVARRHSQASQVFFYIYCSLFFIIFLGHVQRHGMTFGSYASVLEIILLVAAMVLMNDAAAQRWIAARPR